MNSNKKESTLEIYSDILNQFNHKNLRELQVCREVFITIPSVIYTKKNFYLLQAINEKIEHLKTAGLIEYWYNQHFTKEFSKQNSNSPKVLRLYHFYGCFQVWISGCLLSSLVFTYEWIINKWKNRLSCR